MRAKRRFLCSELYFVTIRTVEQRFALEPNACPDAWVLAEGRQLTFDEKQAMRARGRLCIEETQKLTDDIAKSEQNPEVPRPVVRVEAFTDSIPNIIGSCMAHGVEMFGVQLYGFVWMSNHGHLLLRAPEGNFADFMAYLNGQIAVNVNRFLGRRHQVWARRYSAAPVLDEAAELERLGYLLANPQNAGIADSIDTWAGLSSATFFFQHRKLRFVSFNRTAWREDGCPKDIAPYLSTKVLEQELLPQLLGLKEKKLRRKLRRLIKKQLKPLHIEETKLDADPMLPVRRSLLARTVIPTDRPESSKNSPRKYSSRQPLCHTTKSSLREIYKRWYRVFCVAYGESSREYRQGNTDAIFPPGSFAPSKDPRAKYASNPDAKPMLHPTRRNLELEEALEALAA